MNVHGLFLAVKKYLRDRTHFYIKVSNFGCESGLKLVR